MKYSIIIGASRNCFDSDRILLVKKTIDNAMRYAKISSYEIIFGYMYDNVSEVFNVKEFCMNNGMVFSETPYPRDKLFSKSILYNCASRKANGEYYIMGDIDICWNRDVMVQVESIFKTNPDTMIGSDFYYLVNGYNNYNEIVTGSVPKDKISGSLRDASRFAYFYGNFQAFPSKVFNEARGYDERMRVWGEDDNDLFFRLKSRLKLKCLKENSNYHLHHEPRNVNIDNKDVKHYIKKNKMFRKDDGKFVKNCKQWGTTRSENFLTHYDNLKV